MYVFHVCQKDIFSMRKVVLFFFNFLQLSVHESPIFLFLNVNELEIFIFERLFVILSDLLALDEFRIKLEPSSKFSDIFSILRFWRLSWVVFEWLRVVVSFYSIQSQTENSSSDPVHKKEAPPFSSVWRFMCQVFIASGCRKNKRTKTRKFNLQFTQK